MSNRDLFHVIVSLFRAHTAIKYALDETEGDDINVTLDREQAEILMRGLDLECDRLANRRPGSLFLNVQGRPRQLTFFGARNIVLRTAIDADRLLTYEDAIDVLVAETNVDERTAERALSDYGRVSKETVRQELESTLLAIHKGTITAVEIAHGCARQVYKRD